MRTSNAVVGLAVVSVVLALFASASGLLWQDAGTPFAFTTVRGETVQIYGQGLYRYDTHLIAAGFKVGDAAILAMGIPLLIVATLLYRRQSLRGGLLLVGTLAYFLYVYGSLALGAAYNSLFLVYVTLFAASLFGLIEAIASFDLAGLPAHYSNGLPLGGISVFLIVAGAVLMLVWLGMSVIPGLVQGTAPSEVASYTTVITIVLDLAIIAPALILAGVKLLRRAPIGYLLGSALLVFSALLGVSLLAAGIVQRMIGLISVGQFMGFTMSFTVLTAFAIWLTIMLFRHVRQSPLAAVKADR